MEVCYDGALVVPLSYMVMDEDVMVCTLDMIRQKGKCYMVLDKEA